ncbi:MAG: hypothetical protein K2R98_32520 [Gemmataceae bacterium]|nr:hypothetical protein [Gemmataceae bacterium]
MYRRLLEGIAYLFREVWVVLTKKFARLVKAPPHAWIGALTLQQMIEWFVHALTELHPETQEVTGFQT